jgi:uncharacterized protein (DUF302 family)
MEISVVKQSRLPYTETVAALSRAIAAAGSTIFATIDQAAAAKSVGLDLRPTTLLVFGNPKGGTPLMASHPLIALELPLKLLVWNDGDEVRVAYFRMTETARRYGIDPTAPPIPAMSTALETISDTVV